MSPAEWLEKQFEKERDLPGKKRRPMILLKEQNGEIVHESTSGESHPEPDRPVEPLEPNGMAGNRDSKIARSSVGSG